VAVLLGADLYEFSWRYQLPALVTLPVAGAFGVTALVRFFRAQAQAQRSVAEAAGAVEAVESVGAMVSGERAARERTAREPVAGDAAAEAGNTADEFAVAGSEQAAP
jgi:hypothetical protein